MNRIEFMMKIQKYKDELPGCIVPMIILKWPHLNRTRVQNTLKGITIDESIFRYLDQLCEFFEVKIDGN